MGQARERCFPFGLAERVTALAKIVRSPHRPAPCARAAATRLNRRVAVSAITGDDGARLHGHRQIEEAAGVQRFFVCPRHLWQGEQREWQWARQQLRQEAQQPCLKAAIRLQPRAR